METLTNNNQCQLLLPFFFNFLSISTFHNKEFIMSDKETLMSMGFAPERIACECLLSHFRCSWRRRSRS
jgi:hypothetical protein